jgi:hypothetical protein
MDLWIYISHKFTCDTAAGSQRVTCKTSVTGYCEVEDDECQDSPYNNIHKWKLPFLFSCASNIGPPLLQCHCPPPACIYPLCQPQQSTHCSLKLWCRFCHWEPFSMLMFPLRRSLFLLWFHHHPTLDELPLLQRQAQVPGKILQIFSSGN